MRVICPYTTITTGTAQCLDRHAPHAERVYVGGDPTDYWRTLRDAWADGEDFIVWEHDVEAGPDAIEILETCPGWFCTIAGYWRLARFRAALIRAAPDAFEGMPVSQRHWLVLENFARGRIPGGHSHVGEADVANQSRWLLQNLRRRAVWFEWLRTLPAAAADEWTARAWREVTDDGRACSRPACRRSGVSAHPTTCARCAGDAGPIADWPPRAVQYGP